MVCTVIAATFTQLLLLHLLTREIIMISLFLQASVFLCALGAASAYVVEPPTTALPDTNQYCDAWQIAEPWMNHCNHIASSHALPIYSVGAWVSSDMVLQLGLA